MACKVTAPIGHAIKEPTASPIVIILLVGYDKYALISSSFIMQTLTLWDLRVDHELLDYNHWCYALFTEPQLLSSHEFQCPNHKKESYHVT